MYPYTIPCFSVAQNLSNLDRAMSMTSDTEEEEGREGVSETTPLPEPDPDTAPVSELSLTTPDLLSSSDTSSGYGSGDFQPVQHLNELLLCNWTVTIQVLKTYIETKLFEIKRVL